MGFFPPPSFLPPPNLRQLLRRGFAVGLPRRAYLVSGPRHSPTVCLTFDDGPHPTYTPALLDVLGLLEIRATFFVIGEHAARFPELVRRIADEGHVVGGHSFTHGNPSTTSAQALMAEVGKTATVLAGILGRQPTLFRPPHGKLTMGKALALWAARQTIVLWNRDPRDFTCASADELRGRLAQEPLVGGDVLLFHDCHPHIVEALPVLVDRVNNRGLRFGTPLEWIGDG